LNIWPKDRKICTPKGRAKQLWLKIKKNQACLVNWHFFNPKLNKMLQIETLEDFGLKLNNERYWKNIAVQGLNLTNYSNQMLKTVFKDCIFLGCEMSPEVNYYLLHSDNALFPKLKVPFNMYLNRLYSYKDLYNGFDYRNPDTYHNTDDYKIYKFFKDNGSAEPDSIQVTLAQRLHDHGVSDALHDFLKKMGYPKKVVAIMGGHGMPRGSADYRQVAEIGKKLAESGFLPVSGGGPGAMEATHLGAWFAERMESDLETAIEMLAVAPKYTDSLWLSKAFEVMERYPRITTAESLGIPTWLYGHEPPTPFASKIAKYFANSVREEGLLAIAKGGVIYSPGSAGTIQEIFQDATQNHYLSFDIASPMIFLNRKYWVQERPIFPLLERMQKEGKYKNLLLTISDDSEEILNVLRNFLAAKHSI
jgi:predicted Rossmann-fold nucleotide-binding protein